MSETKQRTKGPAKPVDVSQLKAEHPDDPRIGQGYNDARGEIEDDEEIPRSHNNKNNLGPEQKRPRS
jgi:hypothetical protein